jgi:general secretion pathway protein L
VETRHCDNRLPLYANGLVTSSQINLLQGDYSPKTRFDKAWKPWIWTGILALLLGGVLMAGKGLDYLRMARQEAELDSQITAVFKEALPNSRMQRPVAQMKNRLKQLSGGSTDGFTSRLEQLAESLATQPQTQLKSISYRNGRFDLDLITDKVTTLEALKSELSKRGSLKMTVQSANQDKDGGLRGRVRVE